MSLGARAIMAALRSHAQATGRFETVLTHEPKRAPQTGLVCAIWAQNLRPVKSGLAATSVRLEASVRVYRNMLAEPQDDIDADLLNAVDALMAEYTGDFTLGGLIKHIDLLGAHGDPLAAEAGYLEHDGKMYRVMVISVPMIVNDLWSQSP